MSYRERILSKINEDFLVCDICANSFTSGRSSPRAPMTLFCLHTFCRECLAKVINASTIEASELECFVCKGITPLDKTLGVDSIKTNFMLQNLIATCHPSSEDTDEAVLPVAGSSRSSSSNPTAQASAKDSKTVFKFEREGGAGREDSTPCDFHDGDDSESATFYCQQCNAALCASCKETHGKSKNFKSHECVPLASAKKSVIRKCLVHKSETIKFVCETCDPAVLCCSICLIDDGHTKDGHNVKSVEKYVANQKERMLGMKGQAEELLVLEKAVFDGIDTRINTHRENVQSSLSKINDVFDRLMEILSNCKKAWLEEVETQGSKIERILAADKKAVKIQISNAEHFIDSARIMLETQSDIEIFEQSGKLQELLEDAIKVLVAPYSLTDVSVSSTSSNSNAESEMILSMTRLLETNHFQLPVTTKLHVSGRQVGAANNQVIDRANAPSMLPFVQMLGTGTQGDAVGQFSEPRGVCLGPAPGGGGEQLLYVADTDNHPVQVLNATTGAHVRTIGTGTSGNAGGQFSNPRGVCLGPAPGES